MSVIQSTADLSTNPKLDIAILGETKSGKTRLAREFPEPMIISFDIEKGLRSLQNAYPAVDYIVVKKERGEYGDSHLSFLMNHILMKGSDLYEALRAPRPDEPPKKKYQTLVLDSLSSLYRICVYSVIGYYDEFSQNSLSTLDSKLSWDDRTEVYARFNKVISRLRFYAEKGDMHFVQIGHLSTSTSEGEEISRLMVGSTNFAQNQLLPYIDNIILVAAEGDKRWIYLTPTKKYPTIGCRTPIGKEIPAKIELSSNPSVSNYETLMKTLGYEVEEKKEKKKEDKK